MNATLMAPTNSIALFSEDGQTWADGSAVNWAPNTAVTKIVIGKTDASEPIEINPPADLATRFPRLTHLYLWHINNLQQLPVLPGNLVCLDVRNCPELTALPELPLGLQTLVLETCPLLQKPQRAELPQLDELSVRGCHALSERWLNAVLKSSQQLRSLDASDCPQLTSVAAWPSSLLDIRLNQCPRLKTLPKNWPKELRRLELHAAKSITTVPDFPDSLDYINLAETKSLAALSAERGQPRTLFLFDTGILVPPKSEHGENTNENVAARTAAYFADVELVGKGEVKRCKLLVLGNGSAGKTCLSLALTGDDPHKAKQQGSTHGVQFWDWEMDAAVNGLMEPVHVHLWDFGGQEIYHNTHQLFMSKGSVFIVVWHPEQDGQQPAPNADVGYQDEYRPLKYWLDFIHMACPGTPKIAIVCSHHAQPTDELEQRWKEQVGSEYAEHCRCFYVDSLHAPECLATDAGELDDLHNWLMENVGHVISTQGVAVPKHWEIAQELVEGWVQRLEHDTEFAGTHNDIGFDQFREEFQSAINSACEQDSDGRFAQLQERLRAGEFSLTDERVSYTLSFLTHGGWLYWDKKLFEGRVIVGQRWALDGLYTILNRRDDSRVYRSLQDADGRFSLSELDRLVWKVAGFTNEQQQLLLSFMQRCGLCFQLHRAEDAWRNEDVYISFEHLPSSRWIEDDFDRLSNGAECDKFDVPLMHKHHWQQFLVDAGNSYGHDARYARDGLYLENKSGQRLLIVIRLDGSGLGGSVWIEVAGPEAKVRLKQTREHLQRFLPGTDRPAQPTAPVEPIKSMGERSGKKQVFVSYAWEPAKRPGDRGIPVGYEVPVDAIQSFLEHRVDFVRDKISTDYGDSLVRFMKWGAASDYVIVVHSDKYWHSPDCMYELKLLCDALRNHVGKDFLSVIIPVEHLNSQVTSRGGIKEYVKHWRNFPEGEVPARLDWEIDQLRDYAAATIRDFGQQLSDNQGHNIEWADDQAEHVLSEIGKCLALHPDS